MVDHSETPTAEHGHHRPAAAAGKALGRGLGGLAVLAGLLILFGPFLLAPLALAVRAWQAAPDGTPWPWVAAVAVGLGVIGVQFIFAIQRNPLVRTLTVVISSFIFSVAAWIALARPGAEPTVLEAAPPWWERLGQTGWIVVAVATAIYSAVYLYLLNRVDDRPWARRMQLFGGGRRSGRDGE